MLKGLCISVLILTGACSLTMCPFFTETAYAEVETSLEIPETGFNFGTVPEGSRVKHEFELKNLGKAEIKILKIVPSCGCTAAVATSKTIQPEISERILVEFDTTGFIGDKTRTIELITSDLKQEQITLTLKGTVLPNALIEPRKLDFGELSPGSDETDWQREFSVSLADSAELTLGKVAASSKNVEIKELSRSADKRSGRFQVTVLKTVARGDLRDRILVDLIGSRNQTINVPIIAFVRGDLRLAPASISFGLITGTAVLERTVRLENKGRQPIKILDVTADSDALDVDLKELQAGKVFSLRVKGDPTKMRSDLRATVTVKSDHPTEPEVVLNVFAILPQT